MKKIKSIKDLILALNTCELNQSENCYLDAIKNVDISLAEWEMQFMFNDFQPGRVSLSKTEEYDLFLSCWEKGQEGSIHDIDSE